MLEQHPFHCRLHEISRQEHNVRRLRQPMGTLSEQGCSKFGLGGAAQQDKADSVVESYDQPAGH